MAVNSPVTVGQNSVCHQVSSLLSVALVPGLPMAELHCMKDHYATAEAIFYNQGASEDS